MTRLNLDRALVFGFLATFVSSFGQTFLLGLFSPHFQAALDIGPARVGLLYGLATLASGSLLFWLGGAMDALSLPRALLITVAVFCVGCLLAAGVQGQIVLLGAFFLLRLGGQGLMTHLGIVAAARNGGLRHGSTIAWASMGVIFGEAVLPAIVLALLAIWDWRWLWLGVAAALVALVLPALVGLGRNLRWRGEGHENHAAEPARIVRRRVLLRQPAFWAAMALLLAPPFMATGFLFEQASIRALMDWPAAWLGSAFTVFAACRAAGTWVTGRAVDSFGAVAVARTHLLPMGLAFALLALPMGATSMWLVFAGIGFSNGANSVLGSALWLELFGHAAVGLVRGVAAASMVAATALAPVFVASVLTWQGDTDGLGLGFAAYTVLASALIWPLLRHHAGRLPGA